MSSSSWCSLSREVVKSCKQLDLPVKVDQKGFVRVLGARFGRKHRIDEHPSCLAFVLKCSRNAAAGIDQQPKLVGQVGLVRKALDDLRTSVFREREVALVQGGHKGTLLVAHGDRQKHFAGLDFQRGNRLVVRAGWAGLVFEAC